MIVIMFMLYSPAALKMGRSSGRLDMTEELSLASGRRESQSDSEHKDSRNSCCVWRWKVPHAKERGWPLEAE